jgi:ABC-type lipoprotein export system ATPase subunit
VVKSLVECVGVARTYGRGPAAVVAVEAVTCAIGPRARIALTGPSGSGKSTLLYLFAALEQPTAGSIGWPAWSGSPAGRPGLVGVVFQGPSLVTPLDVSENVALPLLLAGVEPERARTRAAAALDRAGVADLASKLPEELSGGQAQRVALARVLATEPKLILADEPTGQLDAFHRDQVVEQLIQAAEALEAGLVIATHDRRVADRLGTRWTMDDGRLGQQPC